MAKTQAGQRGGAAWKIENMHGNWVSAIFLARRIGCESIAEICIGAGCGPGGGRAIWDRSQHVYTPVLYCYELALPLLDLRTYISRDSTQI